MAIKVSGITVIDNDRNINAGIGTFTSLDVPPTVSTFSPADGATGQTINTNVVLTFNVNVRKGTGNITVRNGIGTGTVLETIDVTSGLVTLSEDTVTINPANYFPQNSDIYVELADGVIESTGTSSGNDAITSYNFQTGTLSLGDAFEGGFLICCSSNVYWIASPCSAEVCRSWNDRADSNTRSQEVSGCTGWFTLTKELYGNPFYSRRNYLDDYTSNWHWTNQSQSSDGCIFQMSSGNCSQQNKSVVYPVRSMRCVTY
jgi:hypothetical protein|tara:strand:- start:4203 stop:4979 length:777 start_codon:yes stop_codon:yes gene_type:complete